MRRILAVLLVVTCVVALAPPAAYAGGHGAARVVIGLATFALFAPFIIVGEILALAVPPYAPPVVVAAPPVYSTPPPAYAAPAPTYVPPPLYARQTYAAPAPAQPTVIQYPRGRYELQGDGIATAYQWVWIPNPTIPPPPPGAPPAPPTASQ
jgi:hypothetical protein